MYRIARIVIKNIVSCLHTVYYYLLFIPKHDRDVLFKKQSLYIEETNSRLLILNHTFIFIHTAIHIIFMTRQKLLWIYGLVFNCKLKLTCILFIFAIFAEFTDTNT